MRRTLFLFLIAATALAQSPAGPPKPLTLTLAEHPGYLHLDPADWAVTELSAKPNGNEFGIRAEEKVDRPNKLHLLGFLFVWPEAAPLNSSSCRDRMIADEKAPSSARKVAANYQFTSNSGTQIAVVTYDSLKTSAGFSHSSRAFIAKGDLCADITLSASDPISQSTVESFLKTLVFDPNRSPDFYNIFSYATVLYDHHAMQAAAPVYVLALAKVDQTDDRLQWRRVATDQASMAYGISGNLAKSRTLNQASIAKDPDYPLYYYNLACADAEEGNAAAARQHLQQASDRRANTLKGEKLPDPTKDDSILKLKSNRPFWTFVESLPKS